MPSPFVLEVNTATFVDEVLEASTHTPVVVDFWAPWCGPCRALGPILERLATEYAGRFRLAKVNSDENPELSRELNVRSIPDVRAFRGGQQVGAFTGALPERQVRAFIESIVPSPADLERLRAADLIDAHDLAGAAEALRNALRLNPDLHVARIDLAEVLLEAAQHEEAASLLDTVPDDPDWDARVAALKQAAAFARAGGSESDLSARLAADPADLEARLALAGTLAARKAWRDALEHLLEIVRRDKSWRDGEARKQMIAIFNLAAAEEDLVGEYRRKLASVLF